MTEDHVAQVHVLLEEFLSRYAVRPKLSLEDVHHYLLPIEGVVYSYVVVDVETGKVTDFISFYSLPSSVTNNSGHSAIYAAYLYYYFPKGMGSDSQRLVALVKDALIMAKNVWMFHST